MSAPGKILVGYYIAAVLISLATAEKNATGIPTQLIEFL